MADRRKIESLFNAKKKTIAKDNKIGKELDLMIIERWGFHYIDIGIPDIFDTLNHGSQKISFQTFCDLMNDVKKESW